MKPLDLLDHLLNFVAPALWVAVLIALFARIFMRRKASAAPSLWWQMTFNFLAGLTALVLGLLFFGRDGKMLSYFAMVAACATSEWLLTRGWKS